MGDLGAQQANAARLGADLLVDAGDGGALATGRGLGQVDAEHQDGQAAAGAASSTTRKPRTRRLNRATDRFMPPASRRARRCARRHAAWPSGRADWRPVSAWLGRTGAVEQQLEGGRRTRLRGRPVARAGGQTARALGQVALHDPVLEGVEGDDHQPSARRQDALGRVEARFEFRQFLVHGDAQGLEGARGWMDRRAARPPTARSTTSARSSVRSNGCSARRMHQRLGDAARGALFAVDPDQPGQARPPAWC